MPHMAPIMWALIMIMTFALMLLLLTMIYFGNSPISPESKKKLEEFNTSNWMW